MSFLESIQSAYINYFAYKARSSRSEYWWYVLYYTIVSIILSVFDWIITFLSPSTFAFSIFYNLFIIFNIIPGIMLQIRRFHDLNRRGWWVLLNLIPIFGWIIVLIWLCRKGNVGPNRFGEDPLK